MTYRNCIIGFHYRKRIDLAKNRWSVLIPRPIKDVVENQQ